MPDEHVDVLVVGAGLSGIAAGYHLQARCPGRTFAILEARDSLGGTWDLFRYPGVRSDSDMYTLGYRFRPWPDARSIVEGSAVLQYVRDTAREHGIEERIRFGHRVVRADWSSARARWTVDVERAGTGETVRMTCAFLFFCTGYYRYDEGYTPDFPGIERFGGEVVHPQRWTDDVEYDGQRVVVIGSGATAVTLVPAMARRAAHVTMLQRSPSYVVSLPAVDPVARALRRVLPERAAYTLVRWKNVLMAQLSFQLSRRRPRVAKALIRRGVQRQLPRGYATDPHFRPRYDPWDERLCLVPDGDLFKAIADGDATVVTDRIETFTESGLRLESGAELEADLVVTATGLNLVPLGGAEVSVDGEAVRLPEKLAYKGMMLEGVPNLAFALGYTNASWTLKCELTSEYVCRLLNHMSEHGHAVCTPRNHDPAVRPEPFIDFTSGYVLRSIDQFPKQGSRTPWRLHQNYARDILLLRMGSVEDETMEFDPDVAVPH
ncbi:MAG TPA: NAD(P)/FAD-dependent oxidoreductase [Solirubrobacteraceae bacterium]|nr:NAD(P)/FAD-dependent oxidoreductase [Solirubrobacteraceae bacterium]